jgi:hypothetical protein
VNVGRAQGHNERNSIIRSGIGIDQERAFHGR